MKDHHKKLLKLVFDELDHNSDVILLSSDQVQFRAHKLFLSASSPIFNDILNNNDCEDTTAVIHLVDVAHEHVEALLQMIYMGTTIVKNDKKSEFLNLAEDFALLNIKEVANFGPLNVDGIFEEDIKDITKETNERCNRCRRKFASEYKLRKHNNRGCTAIKPSCDKCYKSFEDKDILKQHKITEHKIKVYNTENSNPTGTYSGLYNPEKNHYECDMCNKSFLQYAAIWYHRKTKHEGMKFSCETCSSDFKSRHLLDDHIWLKHPGLALNLEPSNSKRCRICKIKFQSEESLREHKKRHNNNQLLCKFCDQNFLETKYLRMHIRTDHLDKCFQCKFCEKYFNSKYQLRDHEQAVHFNQWKYVCEQCDKKFIRKDHLTDHIEGKHLNVREDCKYCGKSYRKRHVNNHIARGKCKKAELEIIQSVNKKVNFLQKPIFIEC